MMTTIETKIQDTREAIERDQSEVEKTIGMIKKNQERKRSLESRIKENQQILSDLENRKAVLTIESKIGKIDADRLALLADFLEAHSDEIGERKRER